MYKVLLTKRAEKDLSDLPSTITKRLADALNELASLGASASNIKKLQTPFAGYRKRVGEYRILFEINEEIIIIYRISKRADAYKQLDLPFLLVDPPPDYFCWWECYPSWQDF